MLQFEPEENLIEKRWGRGVGKGSVEGDNYNNYNYKNNRDNNYNCNN